MSKFDEKYLDLCQEILEKGVYSQNRTGTPTYNVHGKHLEFDLSEEFPILTTKFVAFKHATLELLWIYQAASNDVKWLHERGITIWDEWQIDDNGMYMGKNYGKEFAGTIGTAYGYIVNKFDLMRRAIKTIKENPTDRRNVINLFQYDYLDSGTLPPCVYMHQWLVNEDKLDILVYQRSCDVPLGFPFNVSQYAVLANLVAQVTGYKVGKMYWNIGSAHIYENQIDGIKTQLARRKDAKPAPKLWVNPEIKDFYKFDNSKELKDIKLVNYEHLGKISMPVSV
ncbi:MAG: thymidylate synthase [Clostridia bacterium]|nr:thymidylate synthase [Clostridia bacterium]